MSNELPNEHAAPQPADDSPESLLHAAEGMVRSGRHREAAPIYADCIRTYPDCAAGYIGRGRCVAAMDKHADAIEDFEAALAIEPDYAAALYHRAISRLALGRSGSGSNHEAMDDLNRAIELKPDYAETYSARSGERVRTGANHEAIEDANEAIRLAPDLAEAYYQRSLAYSKLGRDDLAAADRSTA